MSANSLSRSVQAICVQSYEMHTGERFDPHVHDEAQIVWASSGIVTVEVGERHWVLPPTLALYVPAGVVHATGATRPTLMRGAYVTHERAPRWTDPVVIAIDDLLGALIERLDTDDLDRDVRRRCEAVVLDLLVPVSVATIQVPMPSDNRALTVARALRQRPTDGRSLGAWGRAVGAGERTLARLFSTQTGMSFGSWRTQIRMCRALELLAEGTPVTRVARDVGYASPSAFVVAFRQITGTTPSAYFPR